MPAIYIARFDKLPEELKAIAPAISLEKLEAEQQSARPKSSAGKLGREAAALFREADFDAKDVSVQERAVISPFDDSDSADADRPHGPASPWADDTATVQSSTKRSSNFQQIAANAFEAADVKLQPFTVQPFREEISRVIATYISKGAPRELNLAAKERDELLRALALTTHPSAFAEALRTVEWSLRHQSHPNFIRWTICNGNRPRVLFARGLGLAGIMGGVVTVVLLTVSSAARPWRVIAALPFLIGVSTLFAAWKGMCVVLHGMHHRHLRPWELFVDSDDEAPAAAAAAPSLEIGRDGSLESIGSRNSYEDEPWLARYEGRNLVRKIFDREVWIREPALRQIQDTIFVQALLVALLVAAVVVGAFCAIPPGYKF